MLKKKQRVGTRLFNAILESGRTRQSAFFSLRTMLLEKSKDKPEDKNGFRLAIAVPKKTSNKAVIRHKIRRRAAAVLRKRGRSVSGGWAGILFVKPPAAKLTFQDFEKELVGFFEQSGVIKNI